MKYHYNTYTSIEWIFKKTHHFFPEEIYIKLRLLGFSDKCFNSIQKEMDRIYINDKALHEFMPVENSPFDPPT